MLLALYRAATHLGGPLIEAQLRRRVARAKEDPRRLDERRGRPAGARPDGPLVWLHGASVGESLAMLPLIDALLAQRAALHVLVTTGTVTSARLMADRLPRRAWHQFAPVDRAVAWRSFLAHWRPDLALLIESELWPNLIFETRTQGVPLALVNGRMSARSFRRWRRLPGTVGRLLGAFDLCLAQSEGDRHHLAALGATQVAAPGNLKHAAAPLPAEPAALAQLRDQLADRPRWLAVSTHPGEEELLLEVHRHLRRTLPTLLLLLVPRHPERGEQLARLIQAQDLTPARRSQGDPITDATAVYLADTLGELGLFYRLAELSLIGGSLVPHGGHNPLEAARLGCAPLFGPHTGNFSDITRDLEQQGAAIRVQDRDQLAATLGELLQDAPARSALAARAVAAASQRQAVLGRTLDALAPLLERTLGPVDASS